MKKVLFISPHPDDETLGCGGTILKHKSKKDKIYWINFTSLKNKKNKFIKPIYNRDNEIKKIVNFYKFDKFINFDYETTILDTIPKHEMIKKLNDQINKIKPNIIYIPHYADVHSDHKVVSEISISSSKWFRLRSIEKILIYETLSETNFNKTNDQFSPTEFQDISIFFHKKIKALQIYKSEIKKHPFPRSLKSITALAELRGSQCGAKYAEAFQCIYNYIK